MASTPSPDRYDAWVTPDVGGAWTFEVQAWSDPIATWQHAAGLKIPAGVDVELMFTEGRLLLERVQPTSTRPTSTATSPRRAPSTPPPTPTGPAGARLAALQSPELAALLDQPAARAGHRRGPLPGVRRPAARPVRQLVRVLPPLRGRDPRREDRGGHQRHVPDRRQAARRGRRDGLRRHLPAADPPDRRGQPQGPEQHLTPGPEDTGSPWAIGSKDGGHDAIHPDLGTFEDFDAFVARAGELGLEVALDLALQAAPDHPWVTSHPEWFTTRADGTIAYAENPPKKYQDIYPINFDNDPTGICREVLRVVRLWMSHGVRIFRVDNPHTKPVAFWEWLLKEIRRTDPDVLFLSEAFTRPAMITASARSASTSPTPTSPGATPSGSSRTTCESCRASPTT